MAGNIGIVRGWEGQICMDFYCGHEQIMPKK